MHSLVLVIGDSPEEQILPFADHFEVEPYQVVVGEDELQSMAEHFGVDATDLESLAAKMPEWSEIEAEVIDGRLTYWSRDNPNGKYDWYSVGGRFSNYLRLLEPKRPSLLGRLLGRQPSSVVERARKSELVVDAILDDPPFALVVEGEWLEQGWGAEALSDEDWAKAFASRFAAIGEEQWVTVVDAHC